MALIPPEQTRSVDPYDENRFSHTINRFTRIFTGGRDVLVYPDYSFQFCDSDSTSDTFVGFTPGFAIKDDLLIHVTASCAGVDFGIDEYYLDQEPGMLTTGWYYVVLWYNYTREYEPPSAYYRILRDTSLFQTYQTNYLFLAAVYVLVRNYDVLITEDSVPYQTEASEDILTEDSTGGDPEYIISHKEYSDPDNPDIGKRVWLDFSWVGA